jgi:hypothetical protein
LEVAGVVSPREVLKIGLDNVFSSSGLLLVIINCLPGLAAFLGGFNF